MNRSKYLLKKWKSRTELILQSAEREKDKGSIREYQLMKCKADTMMTMMLELESEIEKKLTNAKEDWALNKSCSYERVPCVVRATNRHGLKIDKAFNTIAQGAIYFEELLRKGYENVIFENLSR